MESKVLETLKKNFMRDNILEALRVRLDASYNEYMEKEYPQKLADWQESKQFYSYNRPETPKPRQSTDFFLKKTELYLDKIGLSDDSDFVIMVEGYKEKVTITIYILTGNGMLLKIKTYNGEPPDRIDYIIRQDISRVEMESKHRAVYVYSYNRRWEAAEDIVFESEDAADNFFNKLNNFRNRKPGFKNKKK